MKHKILQLRCLLLSFFVLFLCMIPVFGTDDLYLIPGGNTVGIHLETEGLMVTEVEEDSPAMQAGLQPGDVILFVDHRPISDVEQLLATLQTGNPVILGARRNEKNAEFYVKPEKTEDGYRIGAYLRDHLSGIGTVTYYDPQTMQYGALGHGVYEQKTGRLLSVRSGTLYDAVVDGVRKGERGQPGELHGVFHMETVLGTVEKNDACGIFGIADHLPEGAPMPVAKPEEVTTGPAQIRSTVDGSRIRLYDVEILRLDSGNQKGRNLLIRVTDEALLAQTGGIVQGMSGSPILQNGKLVGAVTHVLIRNPTCGYGIFLEQMLSAAQ